MLACLSSGWSQHSFILQSGLPLAYKEASMGSGFFIEANYFYSPDNRSGFGLGIKYLKSDLPNKGFVLTYDRLCTGLFALYNYRIKLSSNFSLLPSLELGYALANGRMNQINDINDEALGVQLGGDFNLVYGFTSKFEALIGIGFTHVFAKFDPHIDRISPAVYVLGQDHVGSFYEFKVGLIYSIN
jgi:hypothetical protein